MLAWCLMQIGHPAAALPLAERAVAAEPDNPLYLGTLGQLHFALGDMTAAEAHLRQSLAGVERPSTRVALARTLAAQGNYVDAVIAAEQALSRWKAVWPPHEPGPDQVRAWVAEWRANILPGTAEPAAAAPWYRRVWAFKGRQVLPWLALLAALSAAGGLERCRSPEPLVRHYPEGQSRPSSPCGNRVGNRFW
jgi:tetratricopeptide (TPR) repeat protein